jgi:membrane-bound lytic murein transglycosylase D
MFYKYLRHLYLLLAVLVAFSLSGCAGESRFSQTGNSNESVASQNTDGTDDPDLSLESSEPQGSLDQELAALRQTGMWENDTSPVTRRDLENSSFTFPVVLNKQVEMYLNLFQTRQRDIFATWLSRSSVYLPLMKKELKNAGLPEELVYLSMIESGYNQRACSPANAVGLWQFMDGTGRQFNLDVNDYVDERRDAEKSTKAAVAFLSELYKEFGDWHLAVAAYNAGPGKIRKGLEKYNVSNFWALAREDYLALETKRYVPKLLAAIIIAKNPEKFGFSGIPQIRPLEYATLKVPPGLSLDALALVCNTSVKEIKFLNQELRQGKTPPSYSDYEVKIPVAAQKVASKNITRLHSVVTTGFKSHRIKRGETLSTICSTYGISKIALLKVNNLHNKKLARGQYLRIPYNVVSYQLLPAGSRMALAGNKSNLIVHRVKAGESISQIATRYNVSPKMVVAWNNLGSANTISAGQQLAVYPENRSIVTVPGELMASAENDNDNASAVISSRNAQKTKVVATEKKKVVRSLATTTPASKTKTLIVTSNKKTSVKIARLDTAKTISAPIIEKRKSSIVTASRPPAKTSVIAKQKKIIASAARQGKSYSWYKVKEGDTLWTISQKFNTSSLMIKQWNNMKTNILRPGSQLKMKNV